MSAGLVLDRQAEGRFRARTDPRYWNQIGPFGGWIAALAAEALQREAPAGWPLRAVSVQFLGRLPAGDIDVEVERSRLQRRVAGLRATMRAAGDAPVAVTADAVFGLADATAAAARPRPVLPEARTLPRLSALDAMAAFVLAFDHRVAFGAPFGGGRESRSGGWIRSRLPLPSGPAGLLMLADAWFPPRWAAQTEPMPVSTVSMQVVFHDTAPGVELPDDGFFAAQYDEAAHVGGFGLEHGMLWWPDGRLALTMQQLTWIGAAGGRGEPS